MSDPSILVLGAGELGMAVLRNLAWRIMPSSGGKLGVILRPATIDSLDPANQKKIAELRSLVLRSFQVNSPEPCRPTFPRF